MRWPRWLSLVGLGLVAHLALDAEGYSRLGVALALGAGLAPLAPRLIASRRLAAVRAPLLTLLLVALPLSAWASPAFWSLSWPRMTALLWSIGVMVLVATWDEDADADGAKAGPAPAWLAATLVLGAALPVALYGRWPVNELAGTLAPLAPIAAALALGPPPALQPWRRHAAAVAALLVVTIAATGSRGGLLALTVGMAVAIAAGVTVTVTLVRSRIGRRALGATAALAAVALTILLIGAPTAVAGFFLYGGSPQGWSWRLALSGRPEIWDRALAILGDAGFSGIGLGTFGALVAEVYPLSFVPHRLDDAHSLPLQTALDLGIVGAGALALLIWRVARRAVVARRRTLASADDASAGDATAAGLLGALAAIATFGVADAVALGSAGGAVHWLVLGLVLAQAPARESATAWPEAARRHRRWQRVMILSTFVLAVLAALVSIPAARARLALDLAAREAHRALLDAGGIGAWVGDGPSAAARPRLRAAHAALAALTPRPCRARWLEGQVLAALGDARRDAAFETLLRCGDGFVDRLAAVAPADRALAATAVRLRPDDPRAHLWLATALTNALTAAGDPPPARARALAHYRRALALAPHDGRAWLAFGRLLARGDRPDLPAAHDAFARACRHGDPGANGCVLAAETALALGDRDAAVRYYRRSRWPDAHRRARALETSGSSPP